MHQWLQTPMLLQLSYTGAPIAVSWPIWATSALWLAVIASLSVNRVGSGPSVHGTFDRHPRAAWTVVAAIAACKLGVLALVSRSLFSA